MGFEPTISAGKRPQTYTLDRAATGTGSYYPYCYMFSTHLMRQLKILEYFDRSWSVINRHRIEPLFILLEVNLINYKCHVLL
jgi:hypothetical protein